MTAASWRSAGDPRDVAGVSDRRFPGHEAQPHHTGRGDATVRRLQGTVDVRQRTNPHQLEHQVRAAAALHLRHRQMTIR